MREKNKSIKSKMKSWIMLSDKELDDTQVYMKEQENMQDTQDAQYVREAEHAEESDLLYSDRAGLYSDENTEERELQGSHKLSRDEEITQLMNEVGQEVVTGHDEDDPVPRRRRKRHKDNRAVTDTVSDDTIVNERAFGKRKSDKKNVNKEDLDKGLSKEDAYNFSEIEEKDSRIKRADFPEEQTGSEAKVQENRHSDKADKPQKTGSGMGKIVTAGIGIVLVLIIGGLGYQNQSLQKQNLQLKAQISSMEKEQKQAEKESQEQALMTKNEDGVIVNTDKMFASVQVGEKEYKLLAKVSDFTKDGWKLEALRNEKATLVPGGKLEKDAFLTNAEGKKIGVIIRNMSDKNQQVSNCVITKLSFSKEMFDGQITLPEKLGFNSTEKQLKSAGFKKDADGTYCYTSKRVKDDTIKIAMADGESVSEITLERNVDEAAAASTATTATGSNTAAATDSKTSTATTDNKAATTATDNNTTTDTTAQ